MEEADYDGFASFVYIDQILFTCHEYLLKHQG